MYGRYPTHKVFDFELGYLIKSPCRECPSRHRFPGCSEDCEILDRVQRTLARGVSSTCANSNLEPFTILFDPKQEK